MQHVHDAADHTPIVDATCPTSAARQQRLNPLPLRIVQPIKLLAHQDPLDSEVLNHNLGRVGILIEYRP